MPQKPEADVQATAPSPDPSEARQLALSLALGWTVAEFAGRYRHGIHPRNIQAGKTAQDHHIPPLSYSAKTLQDNNALFWLLAERLIRLAQALKLDHLHPQEHSGTAIDARIQALPARIQQRISQPGAMPADEPQEFYQLLEDWSQLARLELGVRSAALREAFSFGGQVADLYWTLPVPDRPNLAGWRKEWFRFRGKAAEALTDLERVKPTLPPFIEAVLAHSLRHWQKVQPAWLRKGSAPPTLEQARAVTEPLGQQALVWGALLQGEKKAEDFLTVRDQHWVTVVSIVSLALLLAVIAAGFLSLVVLGLQWVAEVLVPWAGDWWQQAPAGTQVMTVPSLGDWLGAGGALVTAFGALFTLGVSFVRRWGDMYRWLRNRIILFWLQGRTLVK